MTQDEIETLRAKLTQDISKLLWDSYHERNPMAVICPFHEEDTPSCALEHIRKTFKCLGCGAQGIMLPDGKLIKTEDENG